MAIQVLGTDKALRLNDFTLLGLVQAADFSPEFAAQTINEMGRDSRVGQSYELETRGSLELMATGNTAGLLARMVVKRTAGAFSGYQYDTAGAGGKNAYTWTQTDLREMQFDLTYHEKSDQLNYDRSVWIPRCYLTSFSGRRDANGNGSESYNWQAQFAEAFKTPFHDVRALPATYTSTTTVTLADVAVTSTTHTLAYLLINERVFRTVAGDATRFALGAAGVVTMTTTEGYVIPTDAVIRALVYKTTPGTVMPVLASVDRGTTAFALRGYQTNIYIAPVTASAPTDAEKWLKVQSISWDVNLRVDTLRQIARNDQGTSIYARTPTFPIDIGLSVSVTEADWLDWKALMTKTFVGAVVYDNSMSFAPATMKQNFNIVVEDYTVAGVKLQSFRFTDCYIDGAGLRSNVGGRGEMSWSAKGSAFTLVGFNG
jgi:hypothetical protein